MFWLLVAADAAQCGAPGLSSLLQQMSASCADRQLGQLYRPLNTLCCAVDMLLLLHCIHSLM